MDWISFRVEISRWMNWIPIRDLRAWAWIEFHREWGFLFAHSCWSIMDFCVVRLVHNRTIKGLLGPTLSNWLYFLLTCRTLFLRNAYCSPLSFLRIADVFCTHLAILIDHELLLNVCVVSILSSEGYSDFFCVPMIFNSGLLICLQAHSSFLLSRSLLCHKFLRLNLLSDQYIDHKIWV